LKHQLSTLHSEYQTLNPKPKTFEQELDRLRRQRADEFREKRYGLLEQFSELLVSQHGLRKTIEGIKKPVSVAVAFYDREIASIAESFPNAFDTDAKDHFSTAKLAKDINSSAFTMHSSPPRAAFYSSGQHPIVRSMPVEQHHGDMIHYSTVPVNGIAQGPMVKPRILHPTRCLAPLAHPLPLASATLNHEPWPWSVHSSTTHRQTYNLAYALRLSTWTLHSNPSVPTPNHQLPQASLGLQTLSPEH
jgi:hypothetical protein